MLQEAAVSGCNGGSSGYNVGGCNDGGSYNVSSYTVVVHSALYKQFCWEFGVSHNCVCIISEGPLIYTMTCLKTFYNYNILFKLMLRFSFN